MNGTQLSTFQEVCSALGMLSNDREWDLAMREMATTLVGSQLISFFVTILVFGEPTNPATLFQDHFEAMVYHFQRRQARNNEQYQSVMSIFLLLCVFF